MLSLSPHSLDSSIFLLPSISAYLFPCLALPLVSKPCRYYICSVFFSWSLYSIFSVSLPLSPSCLFFSLSSCLVSLLSVSSSCAIRPLSVVSRCLLFFLLFPFLLSLPCPISLLSLLSFLCFFFSITLSLFSAFFCIYLSCFTPPYFLFFPLSSSPPVHSSPNPNPHSPPSPYSISHALIRFELSTLLFSISFFTFPSILTGEFQWLLCIKGAPPPNSRPPSFSRSKPFPW